MSRIGKEAITMLDDMDTILFPNTTPDPITEEAEPMEASLDEMEAPENLSDEQSLEDEALTVEYDDLTSDDDDFRDADLSMDAEF